MLTLAALFCPGDRQPVVASSLRPPLEIYGGGAHHLVEVVVEINSPLFVFWSPFFVSSGSFFWGVPGTRFRGQKMGALFVTTGGPLVCPLLRVTVFWARNP